MTIARESRRNGFTLVELLTVMGIIVILISLLLPALGTVNRYAKKVKQRAQFHALDVALELYKNEFEDYPDSGDSDVADESYCGAMKLCEALMGQDLLGFHPNSRFRRDGEDGFGNLLYPAKGSIPDPDYFLNLKTRKGPYLELENANAYKLKHLYGVGQCKAFDIGSADGDERYVLCDVYSRVRLLPDADDIRGKSGMPLLYYKADTSKIDHDISEIDSCIYDYQDNDELVQLGLPWDVPLPRTLQHPMDSRGGLTSTGGTSDAQIFYDNTQNDKLTTAIRPYKADSYILISAGFDGEYGTPDDIFNFGG